MAYYQTSYLLNILLKSVELVCEGKISIYSTFPKEVVKTLYSDYEEVDSIVHADVIISDISGVDKEFFKMIKYELDDFALFLVLDTILDISINPELTRRFYLEGIIASYLPIDNGVTIYTRRGYGLAFKKLSREVYYKSFVEDIHPIDFNTAKFLYAIIKFILNRKRSYVLEIGRGYGFSTMWIAHAVMETGGFLLSIDNKCDKQDYIYDMLKKVLLHNHVDLICADAKDYKIPVNDIVLVFIDGKKSEYLKYLENIEDHLAEGAIIIAHNTVSHTHELKDYLERVYSPPNKSITILTDPAGITVTYFEKQREEKKKESHRIALDLSG